MTGFERRRARQDITRRRLFGAAAGLAALAVSRPGPAHAAGPFVTEIAPGVFVHQGHHALMAPENAGDIANMGFVVGTESVAVIDTGGSAGVGAELLAAVKSVTDLPIRYVINTHMHPDHVFGNGPFADAGAEFVAHHKMARGLAARSEVYLRRNRELLGEEAFKGTRIVPPTHGVAERETLDLGGRSLELVARPTAHTDNDLTVTDLSTGTTFLGDLLFSGHVPTLDGSILGWLRLIDVLVTEKAARVVPGHGPPAMPWPEAIAPLKHYLETVAADVRALIKAGRPMTDAMAEAGRSEKDAWELFDDYNARTASAAFAELEWE